MTALTTTREFRWDDASAPTLNGEVGSFYALMKACLVGAAGVAYGSGGATKTAAGWTLEWDDPSSFKAVFRNALAKDGTGCYLRVLDDASFTGGARVARIDMYESMSDIDTGTNPACGGYVHKAVTATGSPRAYTLHADERQWIMTIYTRSSSPPAAATANDAGDDCLIVGGGDYDPVIPGDSGCWCAAPATQNPAVGSNVRVESDMLLPPVNAVGQSANFRLSRNHLLVATPTNCALYVPGTSTSAGIGGAGAPIANPSPGTVGSHMLPTMVVAGGALRGRLRGVFAPMNNWIASGGAHVGTRHAPLDTSIAYSLAALAGQFGTTFSTSSPGRLFVERVLPWDAS